MLPALVVQEVSLSDRPALQKPWALKASNWRQTTIFAMGIMATFFVMLSQYPPNGVPVAPVIQDGMHSNLVFMNAVVDGPGETTANLPVVTPEDNCMYAGMNLQRIYIRCDRIEKIGTEAARLPLIKSISRPKMIPGGSG